jgi:hypothetical protein
VEKEWLLWQRILHAQGNRPALLSSGMRFAGLWSQQRGWNGEIGIEKKIKKNAK